MAESDLSTQIDAVTVLPAPSGVSTSTTTSDVTITWTNNDDSSDGNITVEKSTDGGTSWSDATTTLAPSDTSYTDTSVTQGDTYQYRVTRVTDHTEATSSSVSATVNLPAPSNFTFDDTTTEDELTMSWDAVSNATGYHLYRSETSFTDSANATQVTDIVDDGSTTYSYTDGTLEDGEKFYYSVTAYN